MKLNKNVRLDSLRKYAKFHFSISFLKKNIAKICIDSINMTGIVVP